MLRALEQQYSGFLQELKVLSVKVARQQTRAQRVQVTLWGSLSF
jgi:hypothetical protein